ncbi:MAG: hypothetical protein A6F71_04440 [Cycloclasticus sp. symbiont of Poecilosclerida sp. M]|nr:MAG: hypothetical protein A6F71_04440 [Cycloclasticus sp. symbiont of Poecilosclerida sp. M]
MIERPWPDLRFNEDGQKKALSAMCKDINGRLELDKYTRSLQLALLSAVRQAQTNPQLLIRSMHYLYFLVMAKKFSTHIIELNDGLDELLQKSSMFSEALASDAVIPELKLLYAHYQALEND